jgi:GxxExxY protein
MNKENALSNIIIREALDIHRKLGPGLLEAVYLNCLFDKLINCNLDVRKEYPIPVFFEGRKMECGYRADIVVEGKVIIEVKSIDQLIDIHKAQVLTYLKLTDIKLGLLINFNVVLLKEGIKRIVNHLDESLSL